MRRLAAVTLLCTSAASAQVTRTEAQSVLVDALVTDKKGVYVQGLTAADFQVWEDGKEQKIDGIFTEKGAASGPRHSVVLVFDNAAMIAREQVLARQMAAQMLDSMAAGEPNIAVMDFGGSMRVSQAFTADLTRAKAALARSGGGAMGGESGTNEFVARDLLNSLDGLVRNLQGAQGRKSVVLFSPGYLLNNNLINGLDSIVGDANRSNVSLYAVNVRQTVTVMGGQLQDISAGPGPSASRARGNTRTPAGSPIGMAAADASMASPTIPSGPELLSPLLKLAEGTGGFVVRQPDDREAFLKIGREQSEFYILSYTPPDSADGSCHKLKVRVKRDGINIRARDGYCKRTAGDLLSGKPVERKLEEKALAAQSGNIAASMQASYFYKGPNVARAVAVLEIQPANIAFKKEKNRFVAQLDILGIANQNDGSAGARFSDSVKLEFDSQAQVDQFRLAPYRYENQFDIAPGDYKLAIALSAGGESFGRLEAPLTVEPYSGDGFSLSGIAFSREFRAAGAADGLDEFLIDERKKLVADGVEIIAAGSAKFAASAHAGMFIEIYEPLLAKPDPENPVIVAFQIRVLERAANAVRADTGMLRVDLQGKTGTSVPLGLNLPVQTLTPGAYTLEFQAIDSAGRAAKRSAAFEIE